MIPPGSPNRPCHRQRDGGEMRAGGMPADIKAVAVAAKARSVFVHPGNGAAHLIGHREQAAAGILHADEIGRDVMRPGANEHLRRRRVIFREPRPPRAAMDEDEHWRGSGAVGPENVELFDLRRTIGPAQRWADAPARPLAVADPAVTQLLDVRLIGGLIIGGVEFRLRVVQKDPWFILRRLRPGLVPGRAVDACLAHSADTITDGTGQSTCRS